MEVRSTSGSPNFQCNDHDITKYFQFKKRKLLVNTIWAFNYLISSPPWAWRCPWRCVQGPSRPCLKDLSPWCWPCRPAPGREGRLCSRRSAWEPLSSRCTPPWAGRSPRWRSRPASTSPGSSPGSDRKSSRLLKAPGQRPGRDRDWEPQPLLQGREGS